MSNGRSRGQASRGDRQLDRREPRPIADVVAQLMARRGYAQGLAADTCQEAWREVAGLLAEHSIVGRLRGGVLEIVVRNSTILQELTFQKRTLLAELADRVPEQRLRELRFRVGVVDG